MGPWGALVMSFFGGVFFSVALAQAGFAKLPFLLVPILVVAVIAAIAVRMIARAPPARYTPSADARKIMSRATIAEAIGIPVVALTLANIGHNDLVLPGIAIVVGLHFVPMAYAIPFRRLYGNAALLVAGGVAGLILQQPAGSIISGAVGALTLWAASVFALARPRR